MREDTDLLRDACMGDVQAQSELFATRVDPLIRLAYLITHDHAAAEDAVQEALISSTRHMTSLRERDRFDAWLRRIVVNQAKTFRRRNGRLIPVEDVGTYIEAQRVDELDPEALVLQREEEARVLRAVHSLNDRLRIPILMRYYLDMREREIAQAMRLPVTTVKARLHAARKKLRTVLLASEGGKRT